MGSRITPGQKWPVPQAGEFHKLAVNAAHPKSSFYFDLLVILMTSLLTITEEEIKEEGPNEVQMQKAAVRVTWMMLVSAEETG